MIILVVSISNGNDSIPTINQRSSLVKLKKDFYKNPLKKYKQNAKTSADYIFYAENEIKKLLYVKYNLFDQNKNNFYVNTYISRLINELITLSIQADQNNRQLGILFKAESILIFGNNLDYMKIDERNGNNPDMIIAQQINNLHNAINYYDHVQKLLSDSLSCQLLNVDEQIRTKKIIIKLINAKVKYYDEMAERFKNTPIPIKIANEERDTYKDLLKQKQCESIKEELNTVDQCLNICNSIFEEKDIGYFENQKREIENKYFEECK
jgi:hypothetical protein